MSRKRHTPEQIISKLRKAEVGLPQGQRRLRWPERRKVPQRL